MFCKDCGRDIADDARFCPSCGARQEVEAVQTEAVITGSDSHQGTEENDSANLDDTSQSQNLDIGDAPASIQEQKTDKKTSRMVILRRSLAAVLKNIVEEAKKRQGMVFVSIGTLVFFGILCGYHFLAFEFFKTVEVSAKDMLPGGVTADPLEWNNWDQEQWDTYIDSLSEEEMLIFVGIMLSRLGSVDNQLTALEVRKDLEAEGDTASLTLLAYGYVAGNFIEKWNECIWWLERYKLWGWKASYIGMVNELHGLQNSVYLVLGASVWSDLLSILPSSSCDAVIAWTEYVWPDDDHEDEILSQYCWQSFFGYDYNDDGRYNDGRDAAKQCWGDIHEWGDLHEWLDVSFGN